MAAREKAELGDNGIRIPPLCCIEAGEIYRFLYTHAFGRHASIR